MKKLFTSLLVASLIVCFMPTTAFATENYECEPNDVRSKATVLENGQNMIGAITKEASSSEEKPDIDYYKIIADTDGYAKMNFDFASIDTEADFYWGWEIQVYVNDEPMCYLLDNVKGKTETGNIPVKKGDTIYIKVGPEHNYDAPLGVKYKLNVNICENPNWEKESNDVKSKATILKSGKVQYGNLHWSGIENWGKHYDDQDYWKYKTLNDGYYSFTFKPASIDVEESDLQYGWKIDVYRGSGDKPIYTTRVMGETLKSPKFTAKNGTVFYIKITASNSQNAPEDVDYAIKSTFVKSAYWENEYNNTTKTAKKIVSGKAYNGNICGIAASFWNGEGIYDNDYYKITATKSGKMKIYFGRKGLDSNSASGWDMSIKINGKTKKTVNGVTKKYNANKYVCSVPVKKGQIVYIKINAHNTYEGNYPAYVDYTVKAKIC